MVASERFNPFVPDLIEFANNNIHISHSIMLRLIWIYAVCYLSQDV